MSIAFAQNPLTTPHPRIKCSLHSFSVTNAKRIGFFSISNATEKNPKPNCVRVHVYSTGKCMDGNSQRKASDEISLDALLSIAEVLFIIPPTLYTIRYVLHLLIPNVIKPLNLSFGSRMLGYQILLFGCSVVIGSVIRRRQWARICSASKDGSGTNLLSRIEKVEEDLKNSASIVRVLSKQVEKLGIRFRVLRKSIKDPIAETAAVAQKNSETTRILALQEDVLEKELVEVQKVLLAMQEQQQKQLELILAIVKAGKLFDSRSNSSSLKAEKPVVNKSQIPKSNIKTL